MKWHHLGPALIALMLLAWAGLELWFASTAEGLITPHGDLRPTTVLLGFVTLTVRITALFALPPLIAYRTARLLLSRSR
ncbi:MAG TPA: hypothetical protein VM686_40235 [Polyangiaceae bacterium]|nr:hypothetical protein [Polyangiaceae bacterium]